MTPIRDDGGLWKEYHDVLGPRHIHPGHDVVDTVNRLLRKSPWFADPSEALQILKRDLCIIEEMWELSRLWTLIHPCQVTTDEPMSRRGAVLTLRAKQSEHLIDGRRRINHWWRVGEQGPHRVLVLIDTPHAA